MTRIAFSGGSIFDGFTCLEGHVLVTEDGFVHSLSPTVPPTDAKQIDLAGRVLTAGFIDLQVNGGGGVNFDADPSFGALKRMAAAHHSLGTRAFLPTLITSDPPTQARAIAAVIKAIEAREPGILGLHLEGPHLARSKCGAHDPALIRPMGPSDLAGLLEAKTQIEHLLVTVAPESVTPAQISTLAEAGITVALGHSDASFEEAMACFNAGASIATHLFNAMSQLGSRAPGLVGAALRHPNLRAGLIADGVHVHPQNLALAHAAKGTDGLFLVSDAMAVAGTDDARFLLGTREVFRRGGELRLGDGTLAGADLMIPRAIKVMKDSAGLDLTDALAMATRIPAQAMGLADDLWRIAPGIRIDPVILDVKS